VFKVAAAELEASVEDLELIHGEVRVKGVPGKVKTLRDIYRLSASFGAKHEPVLARANPPLPNAAPGPALHVARVRVDPETGRVQPIRLCGRPGCWQAINPATVEEQIHGGGAQGVGWPSTKKSSTTLPAHR